MATTPNGYLSDVVRAKANNILTHGKVETLPFGGKGVPFRIMFLKKPYDPAITYDGNPVFVDCQLVGDPIESPYFIARNSLSVGTWINSSIAKITDTESNTELLTKYDIYWTAAEDYPN